MNAFPTYLHYLHSMFAQKFILHWLQWAVARIYFSQLPDDGNLPGQLWSGSLGVVWPCPWALWLIPTGPTTPWAIAYPFTGPRERELCCQYEQAELAYCLTCATFSHINGTVWCQMTNNCILDYCVCCENVELLTCQNLSKLVQTVYVD